MPSLPPGLGQQVCGPGYFGTRNVADEVVDARELTDAGDLATHRRPALRHS